MEYIGLSLNNEGERISYNLSLSLSTSLCSCCVPASLIRIRTDNVTKYVGG